MLRPRGILSQTMLESVQEGATETSSPIDSAGFPQSLLHREVARGCGKRTVLCKHDYTHTQAHAPVRGLAGTDNRGCEEVALEFLPLPQASSNKDWNFELITCNYTS